MVRLSRFLLPVFPSITNTNTLAHRTLNRNPQKYPDPETYNPARYLDPSYPTFQAPLTRYPNFREGSSMHSFGWGRRTCLGQNIVDDEMFVFGAALLWAFEVTPKTCPVTGKEVPIDTQKTNSHVILEPVDFQLGYKVREGKKELILEGGKEFFLVKCRGTLSS